jgi:ABC-type phosphate transport system substrate-binding protein
MSHFRHNKSFQAWLALFILSVLVPLAGNVPQAHAGSYVLIANKSVAVNSLSRDDVRSIFLGEMTRLDDGKAVKFAVLTEEPAQRLFMQEVVGKTTQQFVNYWRKKVFNGEALYPKTVMSSEEQVRFVKTTSGAIGYVSEDDVTDSVKIISIK